MRQSECFKLRRELPHAQRLCLLLRRNVVRAASRPKTSRGALYEREQLRSCEPQHRAVDQVDAPLVCLKLVLYI